MLDSIKGKIKKLGLIFVLKGDLEFIQDPKTGEVLFIYFVSLSEQKKAKELELFYKQHKD